MKNYRKNRTLEKKEKNSSTQIHKLNYLQLIFETPFYVSFFNFENLSSG